MTGLPQPAFVHDWLVTWGGGEQVLENAVEAFGPGPIHTLIYKPEVFAASPIGRQRIVPSFLQRLPGSSRNHRRYLPLMPLAVEQFDLRDYPVVISSCHAVAHGVLLRADQLHVNYVHSPMRYSWHLYHQYLQESGLARGLKSWIARGLLHYLRLWDFQAAQRPDHVLANSHWTARNVWRAYRRHAKVIYPPVDTDAYRPLAPRDDYYLTVSRLVPYKRIGLILEAFRGLGYPLKVVGDGPLLKSYRRMAPSNAELLGWQSKDRLTELMGRARAFVYMAEEDFGITPVEAQAAGCPVIAYGRGGVGETVIDGTTGCLFDEQSVDSLSAAVHRFEEARDAFRTEDVRRHAERFSRKRFADELVDFVEKAWTSFEPSAGGRR